MNAAVRDCRVTGYEPLIASLTLPDPNDRHVLAGAIRARAQVIVTHNLTDFPAATLQAWDIEAKPPDEFVLDQLDLSHAAAYGAVQRIADSWSHPPGTVSDVIVALERDGLVQTAVALRG